MKRIISLFLGALLFFFLGACSKENSLIEERPIGSTYDFDGTFKSLGDLNVNNPIRIAVKDGYLYVAQPSDVKISIYDLKNDPKNPAPFSEIRNTAKYCSGGTGINRPFIVTPGEGSRIYELSTLEGGCYNDQGYFNLWDVSDVSAPSLIAGVDSSKDHAPKTFITNDLPVNDMAYENGVFYAASTEGVGVGVNKGGAILALKLDSDGVYVKTANEAYTGQALRNGKGFSFSENDFFVNTFALKDGMGYIGNGSYNSSKALSVRDLNSGNEVFNLPNATLPYAKNEDVSRPNLLLVYRDFLLIANTSADWSQNGNAHPPITRLSLFNVKDASKPSHILNLGEGQLSAKDIHVRGLAVFDKYLYIADGKNNKIHVYQIAK